MSECFGERMQAKVDQVLGEFPDVWYRPDSEEFEICVYKPDGDRRYYRHDIHAVQRIESWYGE